MSTTDQRRALVRRKLGSRADQAARYAHDHHVTRAAAARRFGTSTRAVIAARELLYPTKARHLT